MFNYIISLGWLCGTAGSLSKYGFRSGSDPFDWYFSELKSVLHFIETDFSDFLIRENLEEVPDRPLQFRDIKYNLLFNHDIKWNFKAEYADIYKKYMRRVERFRRKIQSPSCFIRAVRDENELHYIVDNQDYIKQIIKKSNSTNEIVFLIPQWIRIQKELPFPSFVLNIERYDGDGRKNIRGMFDKNNDIIEFLKKNIAVSSVVSNLEWDRKLEFKKIGKEFEILKYRYNIAINLLNNDVNRSLIPKNIVIYGAGNIGKAFFNRISEICNVECFIDVNPNENEYKEIPILPLGRIDEIVCDNFVVTPSYDMANIENWFTENYRKVNLISIDILFEKNFDES